MTPLHVAILLGQDEIAKDIIHRTSTEDLNLTFGVIFFIFYLDSRVFMLKEDTHKKGDNTALHLATFLGAHDVVKLLISRGALTSLTNSKGFTSLDVVDDPEMNQIYSSS